MDECRVCCRGAEELAAVGLAAQPVCSVEASHVICDECLTAYVEDFVAQPPSTGAGQLETHLPCPMKCPGRCVTRVLVKRLDDATFDRYEEALLARERARGERTGVHNAQQHAARDPSSSRASIVRHVADELLTLRCPREACRQAFADFEGCFALTCAACRCSFCGWCLRAAAPGQDAHVCAANCSRAHGFAPEPFGPIDRFTRYHAQRQRGAVLRYLLDKLEADVDPTDCLAELAPLLRQREVDPISVEELEAARRSPPVEAALPEQPVGPAAPPAPRAEAPEDAGAGPEGDIWDLATWPAAADLLPQLPRTRVRLAPAHQTHLQNVGDNLCRMRDMQRQSLGLAATDEHPLLDNLRTHHAQHLTEIIKQLGGVFLP
ncbi:uncharacterized protein MONBRDRAFT_10517 [Monosiga brevicollis MX1]|uniref:Uncharacterized protein n=1 Tax=Monosiga brevicollis TaxID=81824 RepID=A9V6L1_MONBE|nr:uncharacterized protein MONBRDRAFT_10517 [Monosiga brevicollis MX1]EDQ86752.1 predicted protein [Monosiga brevicollis MX1]|eukprot:XP_001748297.1 hypothetical protein [Monosiga brevicollis MX1]